MTKAETGRRRVAAARPYFPEEDLDEIHRGLDEILRSGRLILGTFTTQLEEAFGAYIGVDHAVSLSSCTAALQIAFRFLDVRGRRVIVCTNNFPGVVSAVLYEGGIPVLAEMDPSTFCVDADDVARRITPDTAGVVVTHVAGLPFPDVHRMRELCAGTGMFLVEDAAHAHGASLDGRRAGGLSDAGCFSFYATKIMTTGAGGMLTTRDPDLAAYARSVRHHGQGDRRNEFVQMGNDWCLSELHALLGLQQLRRVDESVTHRNRVVGWYREDLAACDWLEIPVPPPNVEHAYYKFPVLLREDIDAGRFRRTLEELGIENGTIYDPPCHLQPVFRDTLGYGEGSFPRTEAILKRQFCPPVHATLSRETVAHVTQTMIAVAAYCRM